MSHTASEHVIKPYDPHHVLHHLAHKDQSRERGQRAPEEPACYNAIADAVTKREMLFEAGCNGADVTLSMRMPTKQIGVWEQVPSTYG